MHLLATTSLVSFYLHTSKRHALEAIWRGIVVESISFREAVLEGVALAQQHSVQSWVADDRLLGPLRAEDLAWVAASVLPALAASGISRLAMIQSDDWLNRELIQEAYTLPLHALPIELRYFTDLQEARSWACSLPTRAPH